MTPVFILYMYILTYMDAVLDKQLNVINQSPNLRLTSTTAGNDVTKRHEMTLQVRVSIDAQLIQYFDWPK